MARKGTDKEKGIGLRLAVCLFVCLFNIILIGYPYLFGLTLNLYRMSVCSFFFLFCVESFIKHFK